MVGRVASCGLLLHLLLLMYAQASGASHKIREHWEELADHNEKGKQIKFNDQIENAFAENTDIRMVIDVENVEQVNEMAHDSQEKSMTDQNQEVHFKLQRDEAHETKREDAHAHSSSHMEHMNPSLMIFFTMNDLKLGKTMPIYFPKRDPSTSPPLLPKEKIEPIPFSLKQLPNILSFFSFSSGSPQARAVKETLDQCERKPIKGETKFCATSSESMVDFVQTAFGKESPFKHLTTAHLTNSNVHFQNYTFFKMPKEIAAPKLVACHTMPYPYAVYYCHYQEGDNNVLEIPLEGENGDRVDAVAICHMDTSQWSPNHPSFQVLKTKPGMMPVCHFFPADDFVWIPVST